MGDTAPDTIPIANIDKHDVRGNGWCFYQAVLEAAANATGKTDDESHALAQQLVGVLRDPAHKDIQIGGRHLKDLLNDMSGGNLDTYLTKLVTPRTAGNLSDGPQEWAEGVLMSTAYTIQTLSLIHISEPTRPY